MCGRYARSRPDALRVEEFDVGEVVGPELRPSWNIAPMQLTRIVTEHERKVPYFLHAPDGSPLTMAGLYEYWTDRSLPPDHPHGVLCTKTVLTTRASDLLGQVHDRSPVVLPPSLWAPWRDPTLTNLAEVQSLLEQVPGPRLQPDVVSTAVNNVRNDGPGLVTPVNGHAVRRKALDGHPAC